MGGANKVLYFGKKKTKELYFDLHFTPNRYRAILIPTEDDRLIFKQEETFIDSSKKNFIKPNTSKDRCSKKHKGGCISLDRIEKKIKRLLPSFDYATTFYDFYDFKSRNTGSIEESENKAIRNM